MGAALEPILARHGVAAYLCGHEHNLQHLTVPGRRCTTSSAAGGPRSARQAPSAACGRRSSCSTRAQVGSAPRPCLGILPPCSACPHALRPVCVTHAVQLARVGVGPAQKL